MKNYFFLLLVSLSFIFPSDSEADNNNLNYYFSRIDGSLGLSQNNVKAIIQDSYGFMWFGTRNRLNRYDGTSMKIFDCYDSVKQRGNNNISTLFEDKLKQLWIGTDKGVFKFDPITESFSFFDVSAENNTIINDWISDIVEDCDQNIWIVVPNQGIFKYHVPSAKLHCYLIGNTQRPNQGNPQCICIEQNGMVWIGTNGGGVHLYDKQHNTFIQYLGDKNGSSLKNQNIYTMCEHGDDLYLGIHEGKLIKFHKRKNIISDVNAPEVHYKIIRKLMKHEDELWVGTQAGLYIINELKNTTVHIHEDPMYTYSLSNNVVESLYKDKEGGVWIGTLFGGANYLANRGIKFERHIPLSNDNSISSRRIREIKEDSDGNIWIGTEDGGLNIFNPQINSFRRIGKKEGLSLNNNKMILGILLDKKEAWIGFFKNGLDIINLSNFNIRHYPGEDLQIDETSIYAFCEDRYGKVWFGNGWGVFYGDKNERKFTRANQFGLSYIYDIQEDSEGNIWVATMGNGVFKYNQQSNKTDHFLNEINNPNSLSSNSVSNITETSKGEIWLSTDRGGICRFNKASNNFTSFSIKDGLPDDMVYKIVEDRDNNLWFGTNNGLVRFNPDSKEIKIFTQKDGLLGNQFNYKSALVSNTGKLYFGSLNGLVAFNPGEFEENKFIPPVYITKFTIFNKEVGLDSAGSPLKKSLLYTKKITLKHNQSNIGFDFVALSYTAPEANRYAYRMDNIDKEWIYTSNNHSVSYAKLPPGKYTFRVKGANNDGVWNETGTLVEIEILPPWWFSNPAIIFYSILLISIIYFYFSRYQRRIERRQAQKQQLFETEKEKELYSAKVEFFTNIAHEIRTPITLINGPLESMKEMKIEDPEIQKNLKIMSRNASELLHLVNQLLDFRKVDSNKFLLNPVKLNVSELLRDTCSYFEPSVVRQGKSMNLSIDSANDIYAFLDKEAFSKIINNMLTNALKYSDNFISLQLSSNDTSLSIKIINDGELIPTELSEKIFDPFYQVNNTKSMNPGSGIGLSLARSLTELHHGSLLFDDTDDLNNFTLELPLNVKEILNENDKEKKIIIDDEYIIEEPDSYNNPQNTQVILVVEDNEEMLTFIADNLQKHFGVVKATNGEEAIKILEEKNIDLVLTDVMMPVMDGFELCKKIKTDLEYSHIPVVLLTAKNDLNSKIHGLEMGADAYVEKPFTFNHLITQLTTLLNNRRREKEAFMRKPFLPIQNIGMNKADEEFMQKMIDIIQENITDSNFNVERLAEAVFMSRSSLHRKIKALTELTPTDFLRLIRLKRAAELIQSGKYQVGEVCHLVGINSSSYFIKLFQKQFGMTPKEFEKQQYS